MSYYSASMSWDLTRLTSSKVVVQIYCANSGFDVYALTELHGNFSDSRVAADLGKRLFTSCATHQGDPAAGTAILLSSRVAAAVTDQGTLDLASLSSARVCWVRVVVLPSARARSLASE